MRKHKLTGPSAVEERPTRFIPYGRHEIDDEDIAAVVEVLRSDWLTTGPKVAEYERAFAARVGAKYAVALSSGTAALHAAVFALKLGPGDDALTTPMTFAATANCLLYQGATPVFCDIRSDDMTIDPAKIVQKIESDYRPVHGSLRNHRTGNVLRAIIPVHYAGRPADMAAVREIADRYSLAVIEDAAHALGAQYRGSPVGGCSHSDLACFSTHPVKHITTGEGGVVTTNEAEPARRMRIFRNHGITTEARERASQERRWHYEMADLGYNYRLSDIHCALGLSQLRKLPDFLKKRSSIADKYLEKLGDVAAIMLPRCGTDCVHAWHLFVIRLRLEMLRINRDEFFARLCERGIGANVHYIPVHLHPYYRRRFGYAPGDFPAAEAASAAAITLPLFPGMADEDVARVAETVRNLALSSST
ncbi:MAG: UDP-4-amino-4,6-dideoxy-N-acetyl-beta-L-altrosamine transaminase [Planctomycetota bacterium]|nr:MAG: UDP-4-amino-4,6-dideoxy-N-acetyl-beta-L-altrosamine transaminase [Planctomycetota bacterium]